MITDILIAAAIVAGFLAGIRLMQNPETALWGNRLGASCMVLAIAFTLARLEIWNNPALWLLLGVGTALGAVLGGRVKMIQMPQMVALLNGSGGAASAAVAGSAAILAGGGGGTTALAWFSIPLALSVGIVTFSGSLVAALKLNGVISQQPVLIAGHRLLMHLLPAAGIALIVVSYQLPSVVLYALIPLIGLYGLLLALRIGGADMPIVISLLNSLSGLAAAICGIAVENLLLTGTGAIVGVAGLILTRIMCRAMNRSLTKVLGGFTATAAAKPEERGKAKASAAGVTVKPEERLSTILAEVRTVIIVPGYGMAVAQAQQQVRELIDALENAGKEVKLAIHPVAGRMPGHMNVLLAEVGIPYEKLHDLDAINHAFAGTDLVIAVGACDVINPAANTAEGTPIYGMPILDVYRARHIVICNLDQKPGYSGVNNTLYDEENVIGLWGDAAEIVPTITALLS